MEFRGGLEKSLTHKEAEQYGVLMTEREVLEGLTEQQLVDYILQSGEKVTALKNAMNLASEVLEGAYGTTVEQILDERNKNGNET